MIKKQANKIIATFILIITCLTHVFPCICYAKEPIDETSTAGMTDEYKKAINELTIMLEDKKQEIYNHEALQGLDDATKKRVVKTYFRDAVDGNGGVWTNNDDNFWNKVLEIANTNISDFYDQSMFIDNVPIYVDEFLQNTVYEGTDVPDDEITQAASWDFVLDNVLGILLYPARAMLAIIPSSALQVIEWGMISIGSNELVTFPFVTLDKIIFNKVPVTDVNIFKYDLGENTKLEEGSGNVLYNIRVEVSKWYVAIRNLCIALSLVVLVYIGVRMAISSIADDKAKYKKMLKDWFVSFALIFVLHYMMVRNISSKR